jgi:hypothetical protein
MTQPSPPLVAAESPTPLPLPSFPFPSQANPGASQQFLVTLYYRLSRGGGGKAAGA